MKKAVVILLSISTLYSCKIDSNKPSDTLKEPTNTTIEERYYFDCKKQIINDVEYKACIQRPGNFYVKRFDGKIIYKHKDNPFDFKFSDFNSDGYPDIRLNYVSNTPGLQELLLYDAKTNQFIEVKNFNKYPNSNKIENTRYYYSYHGSGCAGNDWGSELYVIYDNEIIEIGRIEGKGCLEDDSNGIYIYKVYNSNKKLFKYIKREEGHWDDKWDFIEKYWKENNFIFE